MKALVGLQICDVVSTLIFRSMGIAESNPIVDALMAQFGTVGGLLVVKSAAIFVALSVGIASRPVLVRRINWIYCAIVAVNLLTILNEQRIQYR